MVLDNVTFTLSAGEALILRGPNGSGKTTLLRTVAGLPPALHGTIEASPESVAYGAEAGQFQAAGHSVVMCGPGSIDQAHQPNEYISLEQVEAGTAFIRRLIDHLS